MSANKKYYVSAKNNNLDLGLEVEAVNGFMAAIDAYRVFDEEYSLYDVVIESVEELENDQSQY